MAGDYGLIVANGKEQRIELPCSARDFLARSGWKSTQVVVELNGRVLNRADIDTAQLKDADRIEVVVPVAGG